MPRDLEKYLVELAIGGINKDVDPAAEQEFDFELSMRPHIIRRVVSWDKEGVLLVIRVEIESKTEDLAAKQMAEELFEVANAVLLSVNGLNVKVIRTTEIGGNEVYIDE
jgi:hypothetical protein